MLTLIHQVLFVLTFWICRLLYGREIPPRLLWLRNMNRALGLRINLLVPDLRMADPLVHSSLLSLADHRWDSNDYVCVPEPRQTPRPWRCARVLSFTATPGPSELTFAPFRWLCAEAAPEPLADLVSTISLITIPHLDDNQSDFT